MNLCESCLFEICSACLLCQIICECGHSTFQQLIYIGFVVMGTLRVLFLSCVHALHYGRNSFREQRLLHTQRHRRTQIHH